MSLMIGVISYLPDDADLRKRRIEARKKQSEWLLNTFDMPIIVIAQNYNNDIPTTREMCIYFDRPLQPGNARNILIDEFNKSKYDHLMILDDDASIYDYYDAYAFIKDLDKHPEKYKEIDAVLPSAPHIEAFKKSMYEDKRNITDFKFVRKSPIWTTQIVILNKKVTSCVRYDEVNAHLAEDYDFILQMIKNKFKVYVAAFLQLKSYCSYNSEQSTLYKGKDRKAIEFEVDNKLAKRYDVPIINGRKMYSKLFEKWGIDYPKCVYVARENKYIFPENLVVKEEKKGNLF